MGKILVQAGHVSPRFWEITIGTYGGGGVGSQIRIQNNTRSVNKATQRIYTCIFHKIRHNGYSKGRSCNKHPDWMFQTKLLNVIYDTR
jgi:hypothetical protein